MKYTHVGVAGVLLLSALSSQSLQADAILFPPHNHPGSAPNATVPWKSGDHKDGDNHELGIHLHQHRTSHDPRDGSKLFPYETNGQVWVDRRLVVAGNPGKQPPAGVKAHDDLPFEYAHGHQPADTPARWHVHRAEDGQPQAAEWNADPATGAGARFLVNAAFNGIGNNPGWIDVGTAHAAKNWPESDDDSVAGPANGVPWHSAVSWREAAENEAHELHIIYGKTDKLTLAQTGATSLGHFAEGAGAMRIIVRENGPWYFGVNETPLGPDKKPGGGDDVAPRVYDLVSVLLHETGHVLGLDHFGTFAENSIMSEELPLRDGAKLLAHKVKPGQGMIPQGATVTFPDGTQCPAADCPPGGVNRVVIPKGSILFEPGSKQGIIHAIDKVAIHGIRDLYAICGEPPGGGGGGGGQNVQPHQIGEQCPCACGGLPDFGDAPDSYQTLLASDGPRYQDGSLQMIGRRWDGEHDGQPTPLADGDDLSILGDFPALDDEDGIKFGPNFVDITLTINRSGLNDYLLRAWWDVGQDGQFDHPNELFIDDLLTLGPGVYTQHYDLGFDPREFYSRFRLTWDPLDPDVKPFGEYVSASDGISNGEVQDYAPVPEPASLTLFALGGISVFVHRRRSRRSRRATRDRVWPTHSARSCHCIRETALVE